MIYIFYGWWCGGYLAVFGGFYRQFTAIGWELN